MNKRTKIYAKTSRAPVDRKGAAPRTNDRPMSSASGDANGQRENFINGAIPNIQPNVDISSTSCFLLACRNRKNSSG